MNANRIRTARGQRPWRTGADSLAIRIKKRSASLTELESGNDAATSGARWTVIWEGFRPGPRATSRSDRRSYSGRKSSFGVRLDFFGIDTLLFASGLSRANDANRSAPLGVRNYKQPSSRRLTYMMNRFSSSEWSGSPNMRNRPSSKTLVASSKVTPWLTRFF